METAPPGPAEPASAPGTPLTGEVVPGAGDARDSWELERGGSLREALAGAWLASVRSPNTEVAYRRDVTDFFTWCDRFAVDVLTARRVHLDGYRRHLAHGEHPGRRVRAYLPSTIARKLTAVSSFYRYAAREAPHLVAANPAADTARPRVSDDSVTVGLSLTEARRLLDAAAAAGAREHALVELLLTTALRVSEVCATDVTDLGHERGHTVLRITRKGGTRHRIAVPVPTATALHRYLDGRGSGPLFLFSGRRPSRQQVAYLLRRLTAAAGLDKTISPHSLRHTAATLALDAGASLRDVQDLLHHADPRTSRRYDRSRHNLDRSAAHTLGAALHSELDSTA